MEQQYTTMDDAIPRFNAILQHFLSEENIQRFLNLVKDTGSLIAGGSVLKSYNDYVDRNWYYDSNPDVDIYVPIKNIKTFLSLFARDLEHRIISPKRTKSYKSSLYCTSFLKKNGIKKVYTFTINNLDRTQRTLSFDIMIVRNRRTPLQVVNNFDLTFCQIWYDGEHVYASHPEDVRNKKGTLQGEYVPLYVQGNPFLRKRIKKYINRGYEIKLDPVFTNAPLAIKTCKKPEDDELMKNWSSRVLLYWFLHVRDTIRNHSINMSPSIHHDNILIVPLASSKNRSRLTKADVLGKELLSNDRTTPKDDDYDSEDYTENEPFYNSVFYDLVPPEDESLELKKLLFYRETNKLLEIALWPNFYNFEHKTLGKLLKEGKERKKMFPDDIERYVNYDRIIKYKEELVRRCVRKGTSFITQEEDVNVYDLHEHPFEAGISADDLEAYLSHHITDPDKTQVPCYYKPNPANHNDPVNCQHMISLSEVRYIVSDEFYEQYNAPVPEKLGLDQFMTHYDQTLYNTKDADPRGYGMIYHHTVCPFCLQFESRDSGCAYMTHENRKSDPVSKTPYCDERLINTELSERYRVLANTEIKDTHLQFCAECGRPCVNHNHITSAAPYTLIEVPIQIAADGRRIHDYGACTGGGRAELFARILAIRKVYREAGIQDSKEERRQAALAADNAPNDPALMAEGRAILAQEEASRHWTNAPVPLEKLYNDPAYRVVEEAENNNESNVNTVMEGGKTKRRKTYKKKRVNLKK